MSSQGSHNSQGDEYISKPRIFEGTIAQILGGLALAALLTGITWVFSEEPTGGGGGATSSATTTPPDKTDPPGPTSHTPTSTPTPRPTPEPPPPTLSNLHVSITEPRNGGYGEKVGPNRFKRDDQQDTATVSYIWQAEMSDGTLNESTDCQIHANVSGPQWVESMTIDECSYDDEGSIGFSGVNVQNYTEPGTYTVTVTDQLTGATGTATFTVI